MGIPRRALLAGTSLAAASAAAGIWWWGGEPPLVASDRAARSRHDLFERGLVDIAESGWTMPEGLAPAFPDLSEDLDTSVLIVGAGRR